MMSCSADTGYAMLPSYEACTLKTRYKFRISVKARDMGGSKSSLKGHRSTLALSTDSKWVSIHSRGKFRHACGLSV